MFIVSPSSLMASFSGHRHSDFSLAGSSSGEAALEIGEEAGDQLNEIQFSRQGAAKGCGGGLRRTASSSLHSYMTANTIPAKAASSAAADVCSHSNYKSGCMVEARQVEMDFATLTNRAFELSVSAPNGESATYTFGTYGQTECFSPRTSGCGHGNWKFQVCSSQDVVESSEETIYLDGVGSLFFTIDENLSIRLASQEFLRLPSASHCCNKN